MGPTSIHYASPDTPRLRQRWPSKLVAVVVATLLALAVVPFNLEKQVESRVDAVTGSMSWKTTGPFGKVTGPTVVVSPLEGRLKARGIPFTPSWRFLHNTHRSLFGGATGYECGLAPPIYQLQPILKQFAAASTDDELREFVRVMQSGTDEEQKLAIDAATDKVFPPSIE